MKRKQIISLLLALLLALGCFTPAFAEETEAPQEIVEEIVEEIADEIPVEEEIPEIDETPVVEEDVPVEEIPVEEDDAERWSAAYARLLKRTDVYEDRSCKHTLGTLDKDTIVYVFARYATADAAKDRMHIAFAVDGEVMTAWVRAKYLEQLSDAEAEEMKNSIGDAEYNDLPLMNAEFALVEDSEEEVEANAVPGYLLTTGITLWHDGAVIPKAGLTLQLTYPDPIDIIAVAAPEAAYQDSFIWTSSNTAVVTVDDEGYVMPVGVGKATVKAEAMDGSGKSASVKITVVRPADDIEISGESSVLSGKSVTLKAAVYPDEATNKKVTWSSSDESIATVSSSGKVTASKTVTEETPVEIKATAQDGSGAEGSFSIKVIPAMSNLNLLYKGAVISKELSVSTNKLEGGEYLLLGYNYTPSAAQEGITLTSSNKKVAIPSDKETEGKNVYLQIVGSGTTTITATANDGSKTKTSFKLTVTVNAKSLSITVPGYDDEIVPIVEGKSIQLKTVFAPTTTTTQKVTWASDDSSALTVSSSGKVTAVKGNVGKEVTINAQALSDSSVAANQKFIIVSAPTAVSVELEGEEVKSGAKVTTDKETLTLVASVAPATASQKVTWKSSSVKIAEVEANDDSSATVTVKGNGTVTITATTADKSKTFKFSLVCSAAATAIEANGETELYPAAGQSVQLAVKAAPVAAKLPTITWTTSDANVATVKNGKVTVKKSTEDKDVIITAQDKEGKLNAVSFTLHILPAATSVVWNEENQAVSGTYKMLLNEDGSETIVPLNASVAPSNASQTVTYKSSDAKVVKVEDGKLIALKAGKATITATAADGSKKSAKITVQVYAKNTKLHIEGSAVVAIGKSIQLKAVVDEGTAKKFTWTSSNTKVATVSSSGKVTAKSKNDGDTATITCVPSDGYGKGDSIVVTILTAPTGIEIQYEGEKVTAKTVALNDGNTIKLDSVVNPKERTNQVVTWTSGNAKIATVDKNGLVTFNTTGTVTIKATTFDGTNKSASVKLTGVYLAKGVEVSGANEVIGGTKIKLSANVYYENTTNKKVTWNVSDKTLATIDKNGVLSAKATTEKKTVTVTATTTDGTNITSEPMEITIYPQATKVEFTEKSLSMKEAQITDLSKLVKITPADAKHYISYSVKDEKVGKVTKEGVLSAAGAGKTTVTVMLDNNKKYSATLTLNVEARPLNLTLDCTAEDGKAEIDELVTWTATPSFTEELTLTYELVYNEESVAKVEDTTELTFAYTLENAGVYTLTVTADDGVRTLSETSTVLVAGDADIGDFTFNFGEDGVITVASYNGSAAAVTVPATVNGVAVTEIGADAFAGNTTVTSVSVPSKTTIISTRAFKGCTSLVSVKPY